MGSGSMTPVTAGLAEGNYIDDTDVDNWADGATTAEKLAVIQRVEERIEKLTKDFFYEKAFTIALDGNGENLLNLGLIPNILSVSLIEISGTELSSDYYTYDKHSVFASDEDGDLFPAGYRNIEVTGTYGWSDLPYAIKDACIICARYRNDDTLYTPYTQGSESGGGITVTTKDKPLIGLREADELIRPYVRKKLRALVV